MENVLLYKVKDNFSTKGSRSGLGPEIIPKAAYAMICKSSRIFPASNDGWTLHGENTCRGQ
jgi:hypothetical protein